MNGKILKRKPLKWMAAAACLCLALTLGSLLFLKKTPETPLPGKDTPDAASGDMAPHLKVNGKTYIISPYLSMSPTCPEGFSLGGTASTGDTEKSPYYVNEKIPEWIYVYETVYTNGTVDETNTLIQTEPHLEYVRYVDQKIRGKDYVCYNSRLYISMWSASSYGESPDLVPELYDKIADTYGPRLETDLPEGFLSVGTAEFSGLDTIPEGTLSCNKDSVEVFASPDVEEILLIPSTWHTANPEGTGELIHHGFDVYVLCE